MHALLKQTFMALAESSQTQLVWTLRSDDPTAAKTSLQKWICVLSVFIAIISTHWLCQMWANTPGIEFLRTIFKFRKRIATLAPSQMALVIRPMLTSFILRCLSLPSRFSQPPPPPGSPPPRTFSLASIVLSWGGLLRQPRFQVLFSFPENEVAVSCCYLVK